MICVAQGAELRVCDDREGWGGGVGVRETQEGGDVSKHIADSLLIQLKRMQYCNYTPILQNYIVFLMGKKKNSSRDRQ